MSCQCCQLIHVSNMSCWFDLSGSYFNDLFWMNCHFIYVFSLFCPWAIMPMSCQMIFSDTFLWMLSFVFWLKLHWNLLLMVQLTITQHWFRWLLGIEQVTSHYLNQCWLSSPTNICGTRRRGVKLSKRVPGDNNFSILIVLMNLC